tara:strand:+ start:647 stop:1621 length:975 start_codon:yes stop_codon:yes gene_type:complete
MIIAYLALLTSISIAAVAAWFSIAGLVTIFSASAIAIAVMASVLEVGKLVTASWLYRNWKDTKFLLKSYLTIAVIVLMFITSMGIFGYLSKAHLDQTAPVQNNSAQVERIDNRIAREQQRIDSSERVLGQLDSALDTLIEYDKINGPEGMIAVREKQEPQRAQLNDTIDQAQDKISELESEKFELTSQIREIELEVGPVKYIAEMIYDDPESNLDQAVRLVIIIIVFVFDPLAVLLLIAANQSLLRNKGREDQEPVEQPQPAPKTKTAPTTKATQKTENKQSVEKPSRPPKKKVTKSDNGTGFEAKKTDQSRETQLNKNNNRLS